MVLVQENGFHPAASASARALANASSSPASMASTHASPTDSRNQERKSWRKAARSGVSSVLQRIGSSSRGTARRGERTATTKGGLARSAHRLGGALLHLLGRH